jgi:glycosyltransferase involved in cell wall biosynthesis
VTEDVYQGVPVHRVQLNWTKANDPNKVLYDSQPAEEWFDTLLNNSKPDVIHVTSAYTLGVGVLRAARRAGIPLVLTLMDFWFACPRTVLMRGDGELCNGLTTPWECQQCLLSSSGSFNRVQRALPHGLQPRLWRKIGQTPRIARLRSLRGMALNMEDRKVTMKAGLALPDVVLSHSRFVQRTVSAAGLSDRIVHLTNGHEMTWTSQYSGKSDSPTLRFGYMGQIKATKGVHTLVDAFQHSGLQGRARLDIWGDTAKDEEYTQRLRQLIAGSPMIALRGRFQRDHLAGVMSDVDVLVVPSLWYENAPLVIQEAFASGTPVVATNLGGMAEAITPEVNGLLFERGNVEDLARQLRRIVHEPGLLQMLRAGIPPVKTVEQEVIELEMIYRGASRSVDASQARQG